MIGRSVAQVPWVVWAMFGIFILALAVLGVAYARLSRRYEKLYDSVAGIDNDLATAEAKLESLVKRVGKLVAGLGQLKVSIDPLLRPPVRPAVPKTDPVMERVQNPIVSTARRIEAYPRTQPGSLPPMPYGPKRTR